MRAVGAVVGGFIGGFSSLTGVAVGSGVDEAYRRLQPFIDSGEISEEFALNESMWGIIPGLTELIPIARLLRLAGGKSAAQAAYRALNKSGRGLKSAVGAVSRDASIQALEETVQEMVGGIAQNYIEMNVNEQRKWYDDILNAGAAGGVSGAVLGVLTSAFGLKKRGRIRKGMSKHEVGQVVMIDIALHEKVITPDEVSAVPSTAHVAI